MKYSVLKDGCAWNMVTLQGLVGWGKETGFYFCANVKCLEGFKQSKEKKKNNKRF